MDLYRITAGQTRIERLDRHDFDRFQATAHLPGMLLLRNVHIPVKKPRAVIAILQMRYATERTLVDAGAFPQLWVEGGMYAFDSEDVCLCLRDQKRDTGNLLAIIPFGDVRRMAAQKEAQRRMFEKVNAAYLEFLSCL